MHQQEVRRIVFSAFYLGNTRSHRNGGNACGTNQRIDSAFGDDVEQFCKQHTADRGECKCNQTDNNNGNRFEIQEGFTLGGCTDGNTEQNGDDVAKCVLCGIAQTVGNAAFFKQVA